ncbi:MAG: hypothetical protein ACR2LC_16895 [Pyrinomonadaceae bacterium]
MSINRILGKASLIFVLLFTQCSTPVLQKKDVPSIQGNEQLRVRAPETTWEPVYFAEIDKLAKTAKLSNLKATTLPTDDLEIRFWGGFGITALQGFAIKRSAGTWSALHVTDPQYKHVKYLAVPKSGWETLWKRLVDQSILTLPDSSQLEDEVHLKDGISYVVEINMDGAYRTYHYQNPQEQKWNEAKQIVKINSILYEEFSPRK